MSAVLSALASAVGFGAASLLGWTGRPVGSRTRSVCVAVAGGILLALAFGEIFPDAVELTRSGAVWGFVAGFSLLLATEVFTRGHTHHSQDERVGQHAFVPFVTGVAIHNVADGFALGVSLGFSVGGGAVGLGVFIHQVPVGLSLAAVLAASQVSRAGVLRATLLLAAAIPLGAALVAAVPIGGSRAAGVLLGVSAGVLTYMSAAHLLPEAHREHPGVVPGMVFLGSLVTTIVALGALQT